MQVETDCWMEEILLKKLQAGEGGSFIQLLSLCATALHEYTGNKLGNPHQGKKLNDELFGKWQDEKFARATHPITRWMLNEIDNTISNLKQPVS